ncbi:hypothetical protein ACFQ1Q_14150 [Winogradskyella litorisediminis]|uniref:Lipoprotein n=1 Tax=Winogradskyella litorisediminis TaxID=1156618 RepID=A0ABW3NDN4_9FLAO
MRNPIYILFLLIFISCKNDTLEPFELSISDYNYSLAYSVLYQINEKELTITFSGELENEKDSIIYSTNKLPEKKIRKLSEINIDSLGIYYSNPCIDDGDIKIYEFKKGLKTKRIQVDNYYQEDLSPVLELINEIVPEKFKIYQEDKEELLQQQKECGRSRVIMNDE